MHFRLEAQKAQKANDHFCWIHQLFFVFFRFKGQCHCYQPVWVLQRRAHLRSVVRILDGYVRLWDHHCALLHHPGWPGQKKHQIQIHSISCLLSADNKHEREDICLFLRFTHKMHRGIGQEKIFCSVVLVGLCSEKIKKSWDTCSKKNCLGIAKHCFSGGKAFVLAPSGCPFPQILLDLLFTSMKSLVLMQDGFEIVELFMVYCVYYGLVVIQFICQFFADTGVLYNWCDQSRGSYRYKPLANSTGELEPLVDSKQDVPQFLLDPVRLFKNCFQSFVFQFCPQNVINWHFVHFRNQCSINWCLSGSEGPSCGSYRKTLHFQANNTWGFSPLWHTCVWQHVRPWRTICEFHFFFFAQGFAARMEKASGFWKPVQHATRAQMQIPCSTFLWGLLWYQWHFREVRRPRIVRPKSVHFHLVFSVPLLTVFCFSVPEQICRSREVCCGLFSVREDLPSF